MNHLVKIKNRRAQLKILASARITRQVRTNQYSAYKRDRTPIQNWHFDKGYPNDMFIHNIPTSPENEKIRIA